MKRTVSFTALFLALVLAGTSSTFAMSKKHAPGQVHARGAAAVSATTVTDPGTDPQGQKPAPSQAYAKGITAASADPVTDPRKKFEGKTHPTWCDSDPKCNGWAEWLQDVQNGKLKDLGYETSE